jgi:hypothetical protein
MSFLIGLTIGALMGASVGYVVFSLMGMVK